MTKETQNTANGKKGKGIMLYILGLIIAALAGAAAYHFTLGSSNKEEQKNEEDSEQTETLAELEDSSKGTTVLTSETDSLAYAYGVMFTQGFKEYVVMQKGIDSTKMETVLNGMYAALSVDASNPDAKAYYEGYVLGGQIDNRIRDIDYSLTQSDSAHVLSAKVFMDGFAAGVRKNPAISIEEAQNVVTRIEAAVKEKRMAEQYGGNKAQGEAFLAEKAKEPGVKSLGDGVLYKVIKQGHGAIPTSQSTVKVHYEGKLIDGTVFDASRNHGDNPISFRADQVIKGWTKALTNMPAGSEWEVYIPQEMAYGPNAAGQIPPFSALIFNIQLISVE